MNSTGKMMEVITGWWRNWRSARSTIAEFQRCGSAEVKRIACDMGLESHELRALAGRWPDSADQLAHRLHALRLHAAAIEPGVLRDLQRTCSMCDRKVTCARDLERDESDPRWRQYCPNESTLDALLMETELRRAGKRARRRQCSAAATS